MAARAELRPEERGAVGRPVVRETGWRRPSRLGTPAWRRAEALVLPYVTRSADEALLLEVGVEGRIGDETSRTLDLPCLFCQGGVAREARARVAGIAPFHSAQLTQDAGPHAPRVQRRLPVRELGGMTSAAALGRQRALHGCEGPGCGSLGRNGPSPVPGEELPVGIG